MMTTNGSAPIDSLAPLRRPMAVDQLLWITSSEWAISPIQAAFSAMTVAAVSTGA
jgi:hypothetical protein